MKGIADTGLLVAFANRNDAHHQWAVRIAERVSEPLLTCEAVLAEAAFHLSIGGIVLAMIEDGLVAPAFEVQRSEAVCRDHRDTVTFVSGVCGSPLPPGTDRSRQQRL